LPSTYQLISVGFADNCAHAAWGIKLDQNREARKTAIRNSLEDYKNSGKTRTETIEYRGAKRSLEVITLLPSLLLLNHDNSRLSAQLFDHPDRQVVETDPTSDKAQAVLASLLKSTDNFKELKEELKTLGQQNPGMVSRDGVLINGNTRLVALRENGANGIDVAVLPEDALPEDFLDIEMSLQMMKLTHQDYTFTNQLLLMKRYLDRGHTNRELALKMGWIRNANKKIEQSARLLELLNEVRALHNHNFPYEYFDSKQQVLKDLDDEYQRILNSGDYEGAENLKWTRISGIFLGISKDQVRAMDENFFEDEIIPRLENKPEIAQVFENIPETMQPNPLDELLGAPDKKTNLKLLAKNLIQTVIGDSGSINTDLEPKYQDIATQVKLATDEIITEAKRDSYLAEPADVLRETRLNIEKITENLGEIAGMSKFDAKSFEFELKKVAKSVTELVEIAKKYIS
jgi:hypothetical protein